MTNGHVDDGGGSTSGASGAADTDAIGGAEINVVVDALGGADNGGGSDDAAAGASDTSSFIVVALLVSLPSVPVPLDRPFLIAKTAFSQSAAPSSPSRISFASGAPLKAATGGTASVRGLTLRLPRGLPRGRLELAFCDDDIAAGVDDSEVVDVVTAGSAIILSAATLPLLTTSASMSASVKVAGSTVSCSAAAVIGGEDERNGTDRNQAK